MAVVLVPLGEPRSLLFSPKWAQDVGVVLDNDKEVIQATVYGDSCSHVRERALNFCELLDIGKRRYTIAHEKSQPHEKHLTRP